MRDDRRLWALNAHILAVPYAPLTVRFSVSWGRWYVANEIGKVVAWCDTEEQAREALAYWREREV